MYFSKVTILKLFAMFSITRTADRAFPAPPAFRDKPYTPGCPAARYGSILFGWPVLLLLITACRPPAAPEPEPLAAQLIQVEEPKKQDLIPLTPDLSVPAEAPGYTLLLPETDTVRAIIVLFHAGRDTTHPGYEQRLYVDAIRRGVAAMYVTTGNPFEFLFDSTRYAQLDRYIGEAVRQHRLPADRICFAGMSLAGTRALKFARFCLEGKSTYGLRPRAVALCDAPLDMLRFWREGRRSILTQSNPISATEAAWVNTQLETHLGGPPDAAPEAYRRYSPYVYDLTPDARLNIFSGVAVRAYTEPDVDWWMANRQKSYYGINAVDAAALINDLHLLGNGEAQLITTTGQGHRPDGTRHPHSWSIVDNGELVDWLLGL